MNLLQEGIKKGLVKETNQIKKMRIDGREENYKVYAIRLDLLFYNEQNDRIASWVSEYKSEIENIKSDKEKYNSLIEGLISNSNKKAMDKIKNNIKLLGQREPGVVLSDGRIIDGNRRYTGLRYLSKDDERYNYFEAVILDSSLEKSEKIIKRLELQLQHGIDSKVDYNPIDKLVGIYNDIVRKALFTVNEYARNTNQKESAVKKKIELAELMVEFLNFINAKDKFYIARELELDGPLNELKGMLSNMKTEEEREEWKNIVFSSWVMKPSNDMTKYTRDLKKISKSYFEREFVDDQMTIADEVIRKIDEFEEITPKEIKELRSDNKIKKVLRDSKEICEDRIKMKEARDTPLDYLSKSIKYLNEIDLNILLVLNNEEINDFKKNIKLLDEKVKEIKAEINV